MDEALGPPPAMAEKADELTPMLSQYLELCERYDDALVLFQVGDFYETFCEAAETTARLLEITLTQREDSTGTYPMAGIPIDNAESYIETLLDAGYRVAVADQVEAAEAASGLVDRAVTRVVTPGTLTETELLAEADNNFVACLTDGYGLALLDVSTGDCYATRLDRTAGVADELERFDPAEAVVGPDAPTDCFGEDCMVTPYERSAFELDAARERVEAYFGSTALASDAEIRACGALLAYAEYARGTTTDGETEPLDYINQLTRYDPREYMLLDAVAVRSLEIFEPRHVHGLEGAALVETLDETASALGGRELRDWLRRPLLDADRIERRLDAVEALVERVSDRERASERLADVYDLERLVAAVSRGRADARDLRALESTLSVVPELRACLDDAAGESEKLASVRERLDDCTAVRELIDRAIVDSPPVEITEGGVIRDGYDERLDELRATERDGKAWIDDLEAKERERTGIDSLKVGHNSVHGYYIEVTNPNLDAVPDDYQRRQTLKNSERFYTPELKEREDEIIRAEDRADELEYERFRSVREEVAAATERIQETARAVAELDVLCALATVAAQYDYCRPTVDADGIYIEGGRHPVVERTESSFVPNPTDLPATEPLAVITGPNMSGKSTYMRQVALTSVLTQLGSFVPAERAAVPIFDRVFTRVGASDDIAGGRSTFMVEMTELSTILDAADGRSLVVLDEVGRGTSTRDGYAIAQATTEYLHDEAGAFTLFATHHHELTDVAAELPQARNYHFAAARTADGVEFDHDLRPGAAEASYGVEVAEMAGVPEAVVDRADELLGGMRSNDTPPAAAASTDGGRVPEALLAELEAVDLAETTPLEALNLLSRLKSQLD
ncbi:DNA mismatch repair protein MutS [Natronomonas pharaonis DSM 2160]|uniref:DNA mismatch repair protein MutS n=1 Tax=Natronomonas pharaonis (strain ATCC 35678 / DSM 2160 / CIP 103997 / JCM 8858 / NBRC 14720 / NCIMB 2260 / Gabara) TaxID=348780 RepID=MUTS_NATPD|nr:DNA mismatch repair protein MutS [Natronomonas pharaonis]Q3IUH3.1 RecName: Full=DNA mismatch repair protein MutS [Natronomonas pharaonis DSM 2160]CAI48207.1 DNA mismatch repair protein MutS [Natronomonas pharaonis DSM 2160]